MKLRYTSLQVDTGAAEEDAPGRAARPRRHPGGGLRPPQPGGRGGRRGPAAAPPGARLIYVMTDGGARAPVPSATWSPPAHGRPRWRRRSPPGTPSAATSRRTTIDSALAAATGGLDADVIVVAMGPGSLGVGTAHRRLHRVGEVAGVLDAGRAPDRGGALLRRRPAPAPPWRKPPHARRSFDATPQRHHRAGDRRGADRTSRRGSRSRRGRACPTWCRALADLGVTSMGRSAAEDPMFWAYAGAAGVVAGPALTDDRHRHHDRFRRQSRRAVRRRSSSAAMSSGSSSSPSP